MAASTEAPSFPMLLLPVLQARGGMGTVREKACQWALTRTCPLTVPPHIPCSIRYNRIGDEGASVLAAILKETQITHLR